MPRAKTPLHLETRPAQISYDEAVQRVATATAALLRMAERLENNDTELGARLRQLRRESMQRRGELDTMPSMEFEEALH